LIAVVNRSLVQMAVCVLIGAASIAAGAEQPASMPRSGVSLEAAQAALSAGDAAHAATMFETLAQSGESAEAEVGLIKSLRQAGEFRKSFSYANLTASEHPELPDPAVLTAFLDDRTGRTELALARLDKAERAYPQAWLPVAIHAAILTDRLAPAKS